MQDIKYVLIFNLDAHELIYNEVDINILQSDIDKFLTENNFTKFNNNVYISNNLNVVESVLTIQRLLQEVSSFLVKEFKLLRVTEINDLHQLL